MSQNFSCTMKIPIDSYRHTVKQYIPDIVLETEL